MDRNVNKQSRICGPNIFNKFIFSVIFLHGQITILTAAVAQWLERSPREREVVGSVPDRVIPKTL